jgi:D-serine dehydratase
MDVLTDKGVPLGTETAEEPWATGRATVGDLLTPFATVSRPAVEANAAAMHDFCNRHGVQLAPHAKTTLAADLLELQVRNGAWALTAALPRQVALLWHLGFPRVLLANEVLDRGALEWLTDQLVADPDRMLWMYVDSDDGLDALAAAAARSSDQGQPVQVLVELGYDGGRTGCRDDADAVALALRVTASPGLRLAGASCYEGTIGNTRSAEVVAGVDALLGRLREFGAGLVESGMCDRPVLSAGGSLFFDRVTAALDGADADVVLRSGCYLVHDNGLYATGTPSANGVVDAPRFEAALHVWAQVISAPEPGLVLLDAGRRDLSHDAGLPVPLQRRRGADVLDLAAGGAVVEALSDQHTFVRHPSLDLRTGDLVRLGISHPCTTLDRHHAVYLVDESDVVVGVTLTNF